MKVRRIGLTTKLMFVVVIVLFVSNIALSYIAVTQSKAAIKTSIQNRMLDIATSVAISLDGDKVERLKEGSENTKDYKDLLNYLILVSDNIDFECTYLIKGGNGSYTYLIDAAYDDPASFGDKATGIYSVMDKAAKGESSVNDESYEDEWGTHYSAYSPVKNSKGDIVGIIAIDFEAEWFENEISKQGLTLLIMCGIILVISVVIVLLMAFSIKKAFNQLHGKLSELADGSGDLTRKLDIRSGDEFEIIAGDVNNFTDQIRNIVSGVKNNMVNTVSTSDELTVVANQTTNTVNKLSAAINDVSDGASRQAHDSAEASENVAEIMERLKTMEDSVEKAEKFTEEMNQNSTEVSDKFSGLLSAIKESMIQLEAVTAEITKVGSSVDTVIEAADAINAIATQTNLLSLNASIEAARAGEAGRGFAVVAEEIGKLAIESNESVSSIKQIMDDLKQQTGSAIKLVDELNSVMGEQEDTGSVSRESLNSLFDIINSTREIFDEIRNDTDRIHNACESLTGSIDNLSSVSEENAASALETANQVSEIMTVTKTVASRAEDIKELSDGLGDMVSDYKV